MVRQSEKHPHQNEEDPEPAEPAATPAVDRFLHRGRLLHAAAAAKPRVARQGLTASLALIHTRFLF
jgi:hypothetical protein